MIYDISQPLYKCAVFPGDTKPTRKQVLSIKKGDVCNLTDLSLCAHNGTHVDAPCHFIDGGKGIDKIPLQKFIGAAYVVEHEGDLTAKDAEAILKKAAESKNGAERKILIKGKATVTTETAKVFAAAGIDLIGNESQTVGPESAPKEVHLILLGKEVVLLEGIRLDAVSEGVYMLNCAPLNLTDTDGSPCRAVLTDM